VKHSKVISLYGAKDHPDNIVQFPKPELPMWKKVLGFFGILLKGLFKAALFFARYLLLAILMMFRKPVHWVFGFLASPLLYLPIVLAACFMDSDARYSAWMWSAIFFSFSFGILMLYEFILRLVAPESLVLD